MPEFLRIDAFKLERRIDGDEMDFAIERMLESAEARLSDPYNGILRRPVLRQQFTEKFPNFADVVLAFPDGATIDTITAELDGLTNPVTTLYDLEGGRLVLRHGESWPRADRVTVTYSAGWLAADVPDPIKDAGYFIAGQMFDQPDTFDNERFRRVLAFMVAGYRRAGI